MGEGGGVARFTETNFIPLFHLRNEPIGKPPKKTSFIVGYMRVLSESENQTWREKTKTHEPLGQGFFGLQQAFGHCSGSFTTLWASLGNFSIRQFRH